MKELNIISHFSTVIQCFFTTHISVLILASCGYLFGFNMCFDPRFQASNYFHSKSFVFSGIWSPIS